MRTWRKNRTQYGQLIFNNGIARLCFLVGEYYLRDEKTGRYYARVKNIETYKGENIRVEEKINQ